MSLTTWDEFLASPKYQWPSPKLCQLCYAEQTSLNNSEKRCAIETCASSANRSNLIAWDEEMWVKDYAFDFLQATRAGKCTI